MEPEEEKIIVFQCNGANCRKKKGKLLEFYLKKYQLKDKVEIQKMDCNDRCASAPVLHLHPADIWFSEKDLGTIVKRHILNR